MVFYTLDLETWIITDANKCALEALEYDHETIGNIHISEIIHPEDFERAANRLREMVLKKDRVPYFPLRIVARTGKVLHIEQSGVIFWDENGNAKTFLGLARDVTHRKKQEQMIGRRNEKIAALYEVAKAGNENLSMETLIGLVLEVVPRLTNSATMAIFILDEAEQEFVYLAHRGVAEDVIRKTDHAKADEGIHKILMEKKEALLINNIKEHPSAARPSVT